jgi:hypothetical protein
MAKMGRYVGHLWDVEHVCWEPEQAAQLMRRFSKLFLLSFFRLFGDEK